MNEKYHRLRAEDRKVIHNLRKGGSTQAAIAVAIGFTQGTVSKELSRNCGDRGYRPEEATRIAKDRVRAKTPRGRSVTGEVLTDVEARLCIKHSPEQISGKLAKEGIAVSHESIYKHVERNRNDGGNLWKNLRINGKRRYRRRSKVGRGDKIPGRVDIDVRPDEVAKRSRYGDWEADLIQGADGSGFLLSVYERKSRVGKLYRLEGKNSSETAIGLVMILKELDVKTITYDNGLEFARHGFVNELLNSKSYFCKPYSSWEKGGVENYNGLVRQYFPKRYDFRKITPERLKEVEEEINERPRKTLDYACPNDLLDELKAA
jgi:transposase, IS30 family